jgi:hypothetical protein
MRQDEFDSYELWVEVNKTLKQIDEIDKKANADERALLARIRFIATYAKSFISVPSELFNLQMLSTVYSVWKNVVTYLEEYASRLESDALQQAVVNAETSLELLARWPSRPGNSTKTVQLTKLFREVTQELENIRNKSEERHAEEIRESAKRQTDLQELILIQETSLKANLTHIEKLEAQIDADQERLRAALTANNEAFNSSQSARESLLSTWLVKQEEEFKEIASPYVESLEVLNESAKAEFAIIQALRSNTQKLASLTTGDILAENYKVSASEERSTGIQAFILGFSGIGVGLLINIFLFGGPNAANLSWKEVTLKLGFTAAVLGGSAIAFQLGKKSLKDSNAYKRVELELRAIGPFLADVENADEVKTEYIKKSFGKSWDQVPDRKDQEVPLETTLKSIMDFAQTLLKIKP